MPDSPEGQFQLSPAMQSSNKTGQSSINRSSGNGNINASMRAHRPRRTKSPRMSPVLEDTKVGGQTEAVILRIIEDTNSIIPSQQARTEPNYPNNTASREDKIFVFPQPHRRVSPSPSSMSRSSMPKSVDSQSPPPVPRLNGNSQHKFAVFPPPRSSTPNRSKSTTSSSRKRAKTVSSTNSQGDSTPGGWSSPSTSEGEPRDVGNSPGQDNSSPLPPPPPPPMRSIFPRYDPDLPLSQQRYYPNAGSPRSSSDQAPSRADYGSLSPPSTSACPSSFTSVDGPMIAPVESLERLWNATCGESSGSDAGTFHLNIRRIDSFTYNIGAGSVAFYTLKTDTISDFELHKTHPTKPNTKSPVVTLNLDHIQNRSSTTIPIFPKLAEILAREQSLELARQNKLSPVQAMEAESAAVSQVKAKETCLFEWQDAQSRYKLHYQAMMNSSPATPGSRPQSARSSVPTCLLNASVSNSLPPFGGPSYGPTVVVSVSNSGSSSRGTDTPLAAVDLEHMTLTIFSNDILSAVPSLHSIDTLVAAILTVTVSNETTKQVLESIDIYAPKPEEFPDPYRPPTPSPASVLANHTPTNSNGSANEHSNPISTSTSTPNNKPACIEEERRYFTPTGKQIFTTQAEREEYEQEAELMAQVRRNQRKPKRNQSVSSWKWPWKRQPEVEEIDLEAGIGRSSNAVKQQQQRQQGGGGHDTTTTTKQQQQEQQKKKRKPTLVVEEIDVERYGRYADGTPRAGEKLPGPTRAALRALFWFFSLIMWCLTACVKGVAWTLVSLTQCVSGKKG
ncbi:conserved proline-rich protein [Trichophyton verrucosum HKI 0517]|uniref:Conserved proline-rich protein n=1 Tax=Trichophyton verrucosum (strain HKI 0517) TaxID=663202 RepID=D4D930_TRIVH|nr:conserved proline-rich protein [Trichophyton verrucosum HKI 0517]EFE41678.1 conserved proline-rich protein [Trichophyton verrucosum HKI 0517]